MERGGGCKDRRGGAADTRWVVLVRPAARQRHVNTPLGSETPLCRPWGALARNGDPSRAAAPARSPGPRSLEVPSRLNCQRPAGLQTAQAAGEPTGSKGPSNRSLRAAFALDLARRTKTNPRRRPAARAQNGACWPADEGRPAVGGGRSSWEARAAEPSVEQGARGPEPARGASERLRAFPGGNRGRAGAVVAGLLPAPG
jgi:hypothetical protein